MIFSKSNPVLDQKKELFKNQLSSLLEKNQGMNHFLGVISFGDKNIIDRYKQV